MKSIAQSGTNWILCYLQNTHWARAVTQLCVFQPCLTNRLVCHAHVPGSPAAEAAGQVIGFLHGGLGRVIGQRRRDAGGTRGEGVHAAGAVKAVGTPATTRQRSEKGSRLREMLPTTTSALNQQTINS